MRCIGNLVEGEADGQCNTNLKNYTGKTKWAV